MINHKCILVIRT